MVVILVIILQRRRRRSFYFLVVLFLGGGFSLSSLPHIYQKNSNGEAREVCGGGSGFKIESRERRKCDEGRFDLLCVFLFWFFLASIQRGGTGGVILRVLFME